MIPCHKCGSLNLSTSNNCRECGTNLLRPGSDAEAKPQRQDVSFHGLFKIDLEPTFRGPTAQRILGTLSWLLPVGAVVLVLMNDEWPLWGKLMSLAGGAATFLVLGLMWSTNNSPGKLSGLRLTSEAVTRGTLTLPDKESANRLREPIEWTQAETVARHEAVLVLNLTKVTHGGKHDYILGRVAVFGPGGSSFELVNGATAHYGSPVAVGSNDLCSIEKGSLYRFRYRGLSEQLELVGAAIETSGIRFKDAYIFASTNPDKKLYAGLVGGAVGGLIARGIDAAKNASLKTAVGQGVLVDERFTDALRPTIERYNWTIGVPQETAPGEGSPA